MSKIEELLLICASFVTVASGTITSIMFLQKSLRDSINKVIKEREEQILKQQKQLFLEYYSTIDNRLIDINKRLKVLEGK